MSLVSAESRLLRIVLGQSAAGQFEPGLPLLAGMATEEIFGPTRPIARVGSVARFQGEDWLLGAASVPLTGGLGEATHRLYRNIFEAATGWHLARIWNYVPAINDAGPTGLENYRTFCQGRSLAFEEHHGRQFTTLLPSASAVGTSSSQLTVVFAACPAAPRHVENPLQVPAYNYPGEYGPRAPSFARATVLPGQEGTTTAFVSGTAAIRGHASVAPQNLPAQLECTVENLREISRACGLGPALARRDAATRHFKVYLRRPADQPEVAARLQDAFLRDSDHVSYLHADICRRELLVEIEATLLGVNAGRSLVGRHR